MDIYIFFFKFYLAATVSKISQLIQCIRMYSLFLFIVFALTYYSFQLVRLLLERKIHSLNKYIMYDKRVVRVEENINLITYHNLNEGVRIICYDLLGICIIVQMICQAVLLLLGFVTFCVAIHPLFVILIIQSINIYMVCGIFLILSSKLFS